MFIWALAQRLINNACTGSRIKYVLFQMEFLPFISFSDASLPFFSSIHATYIFWPKSAGITIKRHSSNNKKIILLYIFFSRILGMPAHFWVPSSISNAFNNMIGDSRSKLYSWLPKLVQFQSLANVHILNLSLSQSPYVYNDIVLVIIK